MLLGPRRCIITVLLLCVCPSAVAQPDSNRRNDLLVLMGAGLSVPAIAAYCEKFVATNPALLQAAQRWNERHRRVLEWTVSEMKAAGDLTSDERRHLDSQAYKALIAQMSDLPDKMGYCRDAIAVIDAGTLDFRNRSDLAAVFKRLNVAP